MFASHTHTTTPRLRSQNKDKRRGSQLYYIIAPHMGPEGRLYSSKSTNGGKSLKNSKINSYFTP